MNDVPLFYMSPADPAAASDALPDLTDVELLRAASTDAGHEVPAGTQGTVVAVWRDGAAYEVEFAPPIDGLATIDAAGLRPIATGTR